MFVTSRSVLTEKALAGSDTTSMCDESDRFWTRGQSFVTVRSSPPIQSETKLPET